MAICVLLGTNFELRPLQLISVEQKSFLILYKLSKTAPQYIFLFGYKFALKQINIIKLIDKILKQLKKSISDYEIIAQETLTAMSQNYLLKCKWWLMYPLVLQSKYQGLVYLQKFKKVWFYRNPTQASGQKHTNKRVYHKSINIKRASNKSAHDKKGHNF